MLLWLAAGCASAQTSPLPRTAERLDRGDSPVRIVCFGDSITGVYWHSGSRRAYPALLGLALGEVYPQAQVEIINAGISGQTAAQGLARIETDVLAHEPDLVTVAFGMNDCGRRTAEEYEADLREIVRRCRAVGSEVMFCTPNGIVAPGRASHPPENLARFVPVMRRVADDLGLPVFDGYAAFAQRHEDDPMAGRLLMNDDLHPNLDGHRLIAAGIAQVLTGRAGLLPHIEPVSPPMPHVAARVEAGLPVRVLAMTPLDRDVPQAIAGLYGEGVEVVVTPWETQDQSLHALGQSAAPARSGEFDLVLVAVPETAYAGDDALAFALGYAALLDRCLPWAKEADGWDVVAVPRGRPNGDFQDDTALTTSRRAALAYQMIRAKDISGPPPVRRKTQSSDGDRLIEWFASLAAEHPSR